MNYVLVSLTSFVRNKLINDVYLPLIGDNLAKQIGASGASKRTDLMGMLLLISPPGYGKTTLMEYVASRLGMAFVKVNGPSIGHKVVSLDPSESPNATARQEVEKINLGFEMANNVMLTLMTFSIPIQSSCKSSFLFVMVSVRLKEFGEDEHEHMIYEENAFVSLWQETHILRRVTN